MSQGGCTWMLGINLMSSFFSLPSQHTWCTLTLLTHNDIHTTHSLCINISRQPDTSWTLVLSNAVAAMLVPNNGSWNASRWQHAIYLDVSWSSLRSLPGTNENVGLMQQSRLFLSYICIIWLRLPMEYHWSIYNRSCPQWSSGDDFRLSCIGNSSWMPCDSRGRPGFDSLLGSAMLCQFMSSGTGSPVSFTFSLFANLRRIRTTMGWFHTLFGLSMIAQADCGCRQRCSRR